MRPFNNFRQLGGYETKDGTLHAPGDASQVSKALQQYAILEYNYIVDTKNRVKGFFELQN